MAEPEQSPASSASVEGASSEDVLPGPKRGASRQKIATGPPTPEVLKRWDKDIEVMRESIKLLLINQVAEAEEKLEIAAKEVAERDIDFSCGDHDIRGGFAFVGALMGLINGLASMENSQLDTVLQKVWAADELLAEDGDWAGKTVLRGLCLLVAGIVQMMQGNITRGVWQVLRSWLFLRYLETEALEYVGHERDCVRSTALFALGVFNLFTSMLPPTAMQTAGWLTGFNGGREKAMEQLWTCWQEEGIQSPFAGLVLIGMAVDVSSFLGELWSERKKKHDGARQVLDWAETHYPSAFFFHGLGASYLAAERDLDGALRKLSGMRDSVQNYPAFRFVIHVRSATYRASLMDWVGAAEAYRDAVQVHRDVGRRALCPTLAMNAHLCYFAAGDQDKADSMLELCRSYRQEKKKWSPADRVSLKHAERAHQARTSGGQAPTDEGELTWRPLLVLYTKVCVVHRAINFMQPEQVEAFIARVKAEADECAGANDANGQARALFIQAEAMRQCENWSDALRLAAECVKLGPKMSAEGKKTGALHFSHLVAAYAHYALSNLAAARSSLAELDALPADHGFSKQVEFKATHLRRLVGAEMQNSYTEVTVAAWSKARLVVDVPEGLDSVEWDWVLAGFTISFTARLCPSDGSPPIELQRAEQYRADAGPLVFTMESPQPGRLELIFDNSFSRLRSKTLQCRLQPSSLKLLREDK